MALGERLAEHEGATALFRHHYAPMCRLAYVILGDAGRAEEVVMEAFVHTFGGWRGLRDVERADAYLRRTVVNLCRTQVRRRRVEDRSNAAHLRSGAGAAAGRDLAQDVANRQVWAAVRALPERQRAAVALRYYADLPEAEIAETLGCSVGTVKSQLSKARAALGRALAEEDR